METVIPPRDHGPSTYHYRWDENGEVTQVTRVRDERVFPSTTKRLTPGRQAANWPLQSIATSAVTTTTTTDIDLASPTSPVFQQHQLRRATIAITPATPTSPTHSRSTWQPYHPDQPYHPYHSLHADQSYQPYRPRPNNSNNNINKNRRKTYIPTTTTSKSSKSSSSPERDIVPDYVVNFMRGDTPETVLSRRHATRKADLAHFMRQDRRRATTGDLSAARHSIAAVPRQMPMPMPMPMQTPEQVQVQEQEVGQEQIGVAVAMPKQIMATPKHVLDLPKRRVGVVVDVVDVTEQHYLDEDPERGQQHRSRVADVIEFEGVDLADADGESLERVDSREAEPAADEEEQRFLMDAHDTHHMVDMDVVEEVAHGEKEGIISWLGGVGPGSDGGGSGGGSVPIGGWRRWRCGWRAGIALVVLATLAILVAAFVCLIVAISADQAAIFAGDCTTASRIDWGLHALVSVFAAVLLAGAGYAFQVLGSPTREEVAEAHQGRDWLDIGVPSFRNLTRIRGGRASLAVLVLVTAVLTQILYNGVIYVSQTSPELKAAVVGESFLNAASFSDDSTTNAGGLSRPDLLALQQQAAHGELVRIAMPGCISQFQGAYETDYAAVLLVSRFNTSPLIQTSKGVRSGVINNLVPDQSAIQFCLAQPAPAATCTVNVNASLLGSVALLHSIAVIATTAILFKRPSTFRLLVTLGDAIASFLDDPDPTTQVSCLLSKTDVLHKRWPLTDSKYWIPKTHHWFRSVSPSRWLLTSLIWTTCVGLTAAGLAISLTHDPTTHLSPFGSASPRALIPLPANTPAAAAAVLASLPQLLLALLYLSINSLLTSYFLSHESSLSAAGPARALRVSADPIGAQTTSARLTLPYFVSAVFATFSAGMSFLLSQALFPVAVQLVDEPPEAGTPAPATAATVTTALGLSGTALLALLGSFVLLAACVLALGLRAAPAAGAVVSVTGARRGNPMVMPGGSCSAVISARCHPLAREKALARGPVMWGVVREGVGFGVSHCAFTAGRAGMVEAGRNYA